MTKKGIIIGFVAACILLLIPEIKKEPLNVNDLMYLFMIIMPLAGAAALKVAKPVIQAKTGAGALQDIIYRLCLLLAGFVSLDHGFIIYESGLIWKALVFFTAGLALVFLFFYINDDTGRQFPFASSLYGKDTIKTASIKLLVGLALSMLGVFFIKKNYMPLVMITYAFAAMQLLLVFKFMGTAPGADKSAPAAGPAVPAKIISIVMTGGAFCLYYLSFYSLQAYDVRLSMLYFIIGSFLFGSAPAGRDYRQAPPAEGDHRIFDIVFCVFIYALSAAISGWKLMDIPPGIHGDETLSINMARRLAGGEMLPVVLAPEVYNGMTLLMYWLIVLAGKIGGGINIVTGRWLSVMVGALGPMFVYLIMKNIFNRRAAVLASLFLSCFFMQIFYSRNCLQWIYVPALAAASYYFFLRAMKRGNPAYFIAAGALIAVNLCFYSAAKASPFVVILYLAFMLIRKETRGEAVANWRGIVIMVVAMVFVFLPVIDYMIHYPKEYFTRMSGVSILNGLPANIDGFRGLADNMLKNIQMFMTQSANGYCHNIPQKPFFNGFTAYTALLGLGYLLYTWKRESSAFIILWLFFGLLPGFLSHLGPEDPYPARTVLSIPAVVILVALGLDRTLAKIESLWPRILKYVAPLVILYFTVWYTYTSLRDYFVIFANDPHTQVYYKMPELMIAKRILKDKNEIFHVTTRFANNFYYNDMPGIDGSRTKTEDISVFSLSRLYNDKKMDAGVIGEGIYYKTMPIYREYFPDAKITTIWDTNFWMLDKTSSLKYCYGWKYPDKVIELNQYMAWFYAYDAKVKYALLSVADIPAMDITGAYSLKAVFYKDGKPAAERQVYGGLMAADFPFERAVITGLIDIPAYKKYEFMLDGAAAQIYIDNSPVKGPMELYMGLHRIKIVLGSQASLRAGLKWRPEGTPAFARIERCYLINSDRIFGLLGTYTLNNKVIYKMLEPAIDYRLYYEVHRPPYEAAGVTGCGVSWDGYINIPAPGNYEFKLDTLYDARIMIDGRAVYTKENGLNGRENISSVRLEKGRKKVSVRGNYQYMSNLWDPGSTLRLIYKKPGYPEFGPVTYDMLSPGI